MQKKNIAVDVLNRALKEYVDQIGKQNVVLMEKFSTKFKKIADNTFCITGENGKETIIRLK